MCSARMVNRAGYIAGRPLYNRAAGCITGHPVDQPSMHCDRLCNRVGIKISRYVANRANPDIQPRCTTGQLPDV